MSRLCELSTLSPSNKLLLSITILWELDFCQLKSAYISCCICITKITFEMVNMNMHQNTPHQPTPTLSYSAIIFCYLLYSAYYTKILINVLLRRHRIRKNDLKLLLLLATLSSLPILACGRRLS
jgi:hypothetical protein